MNIKRTISISFLIGASSFLNGVHAQTDRSKDEEVRVEWDFTKRQSIRSAPFSRPSWNLDPSRVSKSDENKVVLIKDTEERTWSVQFADGTIRRMLQRWSNEVGYQLLWDVPRDFPIEVEMNRPAFRGDQLL